MEYDKLILTCLQNTFGFNDFKGNQKEVILNILNQKNTFVIMPTGGGKSLCYQLPALQGNLFRFFSLKSNHFGFLVLFIELLT